MIVNNFLYHIIFVLNWSLKVPHGDGQTLVAPIQLVLQFSQHAALLTVKPSGVVVLWINLGLLEGKISIVHRTLGSLWFVWFAR